MEFSKVKIFTIVPSENANAVCESLGKAGAGQIGEYSFCSYTTNGIGHFLPSANVYPHIGESGKLGLVEEERIEVVCDRDEAKSVIAAMQPAHPYKEVAFNVYPLIQESDI